jgi:hypothetical protein
MSNTNKDFRLSKASKTRIALSRYLRKDYDRSALKRSLIDAEYSEAEAVKRMKTSRKDRDTEAKE